MNQPGKSLKGKIDMSNRLVILGGNPETAAFVKSLKELKIYVIIVDPNPDAPAKKFADAAYDVDALNFNALLKLLRTIHFDGLIVGVADILVPNYYKVCKALNLNCYANKKTIQAFGSKDGFNKICFENNINVTPSYSLKTHNFNDRDFPLLVKPVDNGAGVGMSICKNISGLTNAINHAERNSKSKRILIEKFMDCDDFFVYYTFLDGKIYLSATADRHKSRQNNSGSPVCIGASYPSKHQQQFCEEINPKLISMFKKLGIKNGVLNIQFFRDKHGFYAYDPGFRLQGEAPHLHILHALNVDQRELLSNYALSKSSDYAHKNLCDRFVGDNLYAATAWVLLNEGTLYRIEGLKKIKELASYKECIQRLFIGDKVSSSMIDTERQVFARFYFQNKDLVALKRDVKIFSQLLKISNKNGSLISDIFDDTFL